jgi:DNA-binding LacI/PurR family transcriptional regulator
VATIADVAKRAGVAPSTVSRALNDSGYVSRETRERVLAAIDELNYVPNIHAERLRTGVSRAIAFVAMDLSNPFWIEVARGVEDTVWKQGYELVLYNTAGDPERERATAKGLRRRYVDGAIFPWMSSGWDELGKLDSAGVMIVVLGQAPEEYGLDRFTIDNVRGAYLATEYLLQLGHRRIAFVSADWTREREYGYRSALSDYGIAPNETQVIRESAVPEFEKGRHVVQRLLHGPERPTAVFAYNDVTAIGLWMELEKHGIRVPEDVSLVGFDDIPTATLIRSGLTTIALPQYEIGRQAASFLLRRIVSGESSSGQRITLDSGLIVRGSTRALA